MAKSNIDYLREHLSDDDTAIEWLDALVQDHADALESAKDDRDEFERQKDALEAERDELQSQLDAVPDFKTIDFGYGELLWASSSLPIQNRMEDMARTVTGV